MDQQTEVKKLIKQKKEKKKQTTKLHQFLEVLRLYNRNYLEVF